MTNLLCTKFSKNKKHVEEVDLLSYPIGVGSPFTLVLWCRPCSHFKQNINTVVWEYRQQILLFITYISFLPLLLLLISFLGAPFPLPWELPWVHVIQNMNCLPMLCSPPWQIIRAAPAETEDGRRVPCLPLFIIQSAASLVLFILIMIGLHSLD